MDFITEVGTNEKHTVHFHFNQWLGQVNITVDGEDAASRWRMFTVHPMQRFEFPVGQDEQHEVVIEKTRAPVLGGLLSQTCRVIVDNQPAAEYHGSVTGKTTRL
jgi:hypothetical protein